MHIHVDFPASIAFNLINDPGDIVPAKNVSTQDGKALFHLPYNPALDHALGGIFGGTMSSMLDLGGWFTVAPHYENWIATIEFETRLLVPLKGVDLWSTASIIRRGKQLSFAHMEVRTAEQQVVAYGSGTFQLSSKTRDEAYKS